MSMGKRKRAPQQGNKWVATQDLGDVCAAGVASSLNDRSLTPAKQDDCTRYIFVDDRTS
jgi:hypothetical protein